MKLDYRPEIDGLRAIAVTSVIIYHVDLTIDTTQVLPGGFLGVDVFFVISGFLITSLILSEIKLAGSFSILNFYERRARRILPALLVVMVSVLPVAWVVLLPEQLIDFSKSVLSSLFFGSNFYWEQTLKQYGAESAKFKPLLHTWTLAVEEQFYIIFPLVIAAIYRWRKSIVLPVLIVFFLVSLLFSEWMTKENYSFSFYLLPTRFWELLAGGILAFVSQQLKIDFISKLGSELLTSSGLILIVGSMLFIDLDSGHPGYITLLPVLGTLVIIGSVNSQTTVYRLLASRLFVGTGLISYSLYLWHYPVFAFSRLSQFEYGQVDRVKWLILIVILSILSYLFIEKPFRNRRVMSLGSLFVFLSFLFSVAFIFSVYSIVNDGVKSRHSDLVALYGKNEFDNARLKKLSNSIRRKLILDAGFKSAREYERDVLWFSSKINTKKTLILGNSHAKNMFIIFHQNLDRFPEFEFAIFRMQIDAEEKDYKDLFSSLNFLAADVILISTNFRNDEGRQDLDALPGFIDKLKSKGKEVWLASNSPKFVSYESETIFDKLLRNNSKEFTPLVVNHRYYLKQLPRVGLINKRLRVIAEDREIPFLDKNKFTCNDESRACTGITPQGYKVYFDGEHYTLEGARYFGKIIQEIRWLQDF